MGYRTLASFLGMAVAVAFASLSSDFAEGVCPFRKIGGQNGMSRVVGRPISSEMEREIQKVLKSFRTQPGLNGITAALPGNFTDRQLATIAALLLDLRMDTDEPLSTEEIESILDSII